MELVIFLLLILDYLRGFSMFYFLTCILLCIQAYATTTGNQTDIYSPILPPDSLPFRIRIELDEWQLPAGLHSFSYGKHDGKWLLIGGRWNGLHDLDPNPDAFPPNQQNTTVYVVDPQFKTIVSRSLKDPDAELSQSQIDLLSVTSAPAHQVCNTLYIVGGYGFDTAAGVFTTKDTLTAIDVPGLMHWVLYGVGSARQCIRQVSDPFLQVTGGYLTKASSQDPFLLIFGQNFPGFYQNVDSGFYTQQVRALEILDNGRDLWIHPYPSAEPNPNYLRRDLNVVPIIKHKETGFERAYLALAGVFFPPDGGAWTIPVRIDPQGQSFMLNPECPDIFKQGINLYVCANTGFFSKQTKEMFLVLLGGITYLFPTEHGFKGDPELPFTNSITTVKINEHGHFQQFLMDSTYPFMFSSLGTELLFGTSAEFIRADDLSIFSNGVIDLDEELSSPRLIGHIVGGIQSALPNVTKTSDSAASPYIFRVILEPRGL